MSYLTLTKQEIKELLGIRFTYLMGYLIVTIILFLGYLEAVRYFIPRVLNSYPLFATLAFVLFSFVCLLYLNREYIQEIIQKKKRVYKGVLAVKSSSQREYSFHMDGYTFSVGKENYNRFSEGDFVEFHISPSTKHLFKVVKIG